MSTASETSAVYDGHRLVVFTAVWIPVQFICVALRYLARYISSGSWGLDDILVLTSLFLQLCQAGVDIASVRHAGVGYHVSYLSEKDPEKLIIFSKYLVTISILYWVTVNIPKLAILAFYHRLFPNKSNRIPIVLLMAFCIALMIATLIAAFTACIPFSANWNPKEPGAHCVNKEALFRYTSLPNIFSDICMLILPAKVVWKLHMSTRLKIGLFITFLVGSFGLITSIVRFTEFFHSNSFIDATWSAVNLVIWTQIEPGVYLISACLMTYRPLLERVARGNIVEKLTHRSSKNSSANYQRSSIEVPLKARTTTDTKGYESLSNVAAGGESWIRVTTNVNVANAPKTAKYHGHPEGVPGV